MVDPVTGCLQVNEMILELEDTGVFCVTVPLSLQEVLHAYPQIIVDPLDSGVVRVRLSGDAYNRKTLNRVKKTLPKPQVCIILCLLNAMNS